MLTSALVSGLESASELDLVRRFRTLFQRAKNYMTPESINYRRIRALKDIHRGRRGVVIGNGPSLKISDLERLSGDITFASNKIFLAFGETSWRPTYLFCSDILVAKNNREALNSLSIPKIFGDSVKSVFPDRKDIAWLVEDGSPPQRFSEDCATRVFGGFSVTYFQLQMALYMGIREVYLIGMDFSFDVPKASGEVCAHGEVIVSEGEVNHFHKDYRKPGETWTMPRLDKQLEAFTCAKEAFERAGGRAYNASRATKLDVFPRVEFDDIFS